MHTIDLDQSNGHLASNDFFVAARKELVRVEEALSQAIDTNSIIAVVREAARNLTKADGATLVLRNGDNCHYVEENAIFPLWKGQFFPMETCISGWVMLNKKTVIIEDVFQDPRIPAGVYRSTFVKSLAMVPIRADNPIGAIGNYWANCHLSSKEELRILQALAHITSVAMENVEH